MSDDRVMTDEEMREAFAWTPEELMQMQFPAAARATKAKLKGEFVMVPHAWIERLAGASGATYGLAIELLYLAWRRKGKELTLSNRTAGVSRYSKWRGLRELEKRGLVTVELRPKRSPTVRLQHV
jgi:hypothetical protein